MILNVNFCQCRFEKVPFIKNLVRQIGIFLNVFFLLLQIKKFLILNGEYVPIYCKYKVILFIDSRFEIGWWVAGARQIAMALYAIPVKAMRP